MWGWQIVRREYSEAETCPGQVSGPLFFLFFLSLLMKNWTFACYSIDAINGSGLLYCYSSREAVKSWAFGGRNMPRTSVWPPSLASFSLDVLLIPFKTSLGQSYGTWWDIYLLNYASGSWILFCLMLWMWLFNQIKNQMELDGIGHWDLESGWNSRIRERIEWNR